MTTLRMLQEAVRLHAAAYQSWCSAGRLLHHHTYPVFRAARALRFELQAAYAAEVRRQYGLPEC
jgi:hypothetical protein